MNKTELLEKINRVANASDAEAVRKGNAEQERQRAIATTISTLAPRIVNEELNIEKFNQHWKEVRYMTISLERLNTLIYELSTLIRHTPEVSGVLGEICETIDKALGAVEIGDINDFRYNQVPNYSDFD